MSSFEKSKSKFHRKDRLRFPQNISEWRNDYDSIDCWRNDGSVAAPIRCWVGFCTQNTELVQSWRKLCTVTKVNEWKHIPEQKAAKAEKYLQVACKVKARTDWNSQSPSLTILLKEYRRELHWVFQGFHFRNDKQAETSVEQAFMMYHSKPLLQQHTSTAVSLRGRRCCLETLLNIQRSIPRCLLLQLHCRVRPKHFVGWNRVLLADKTNRLGDSL